MVFPLLLPMLLALQPGAPVRLDGEFKEWPPASSQRPQVRAGGDVDSVYLLLELPGGPVNLQGLDAPMRLQLDWDNNTRTGGRAGTINGADLEVIFSPANSRRGGGVATRWPGERGDETQHWEATGLVFAPTTASTRFEVRLPRTLSTPSGAVTAGDTVKWSLDGAARRAVSGTASTGIDRATIAPWMTTPLPAPAAQIVRVVSWNLERGNMIDEAPSVKRLIAAMKPHVLLVQELSSDQTEQDVRRVLSEALPGTRWTIDIGANSGGLRSAIATILSARDAPEFDSLKRPSDTKRPVRVAALEVDVPGVGPVLAVSAHLKCCGVAEGPEDITRIGEVLAIRRAIEATASASRLKGLIVGGDLNLVGTEMPLEILAHEGSALIDTGVHEGEDLLVIEALQPDGAGLTTWQKPGQPYSPGRLDYILVDSTTLTPTGTLVLDTLDFDDLTLSTMGLSRADAGRASDHLPVIVDLRPRKR